MAKLVRVCIGGGVDIGVDLKAWDDDVLRAWNEIPLGCEKAVNLEAWDEIPLGYDRGASRLFTNGFLHHRGETDEWIFEFLPLGFDLIHNGIRDDNQRLIVA